MAVKITAIFICGVFMNTDLVKLKELFVNYDWFDSVGLDKYNRFVVYSKYMNGDILRIVPDTYNNVQVLLHFASSKSENINGKYGSISTNTYKNVDYDIVDLIGNIEELKLNYDNNTLIDIFYEVHDGINSVTFKSEIFPQLRIKLEHLYDTFGFYVLYEQLVK